MMRMLNYPSLFLYPHDKHFKQEILLYLHYYLNLNAILYYMQSELGDGLLGKYFNIFQILQASITMDFLEFYKISKWDYSVVWSIYWVKSSIMVSLRDNDFQHQTKENLKLRIFNTGIINLSCVVLYGLFHVIFSIWTV
jgi:hypothetical protein